MKLTHIVSGALAAAFAASFAVVAAAQEQQAGNQASTNAAETFQKLIEQCDNTDVLVQRATIRLRLGRTTPEAQATAQTLMDEGLALCGEGKIDEAKAKMTESLEIADAGVTEKFGQDASTEVASSDANEEAAAEEPAEAEQKPWWQFW